MSISRAALILAWCPLLVSPVFGQSQGQAYVAAGPATTGEDWTPHLAVGGERISSQGLSAGVDAGVLFGRTGFRPGHPQGQSYRQYVLSLTGGAHALKSFAGTPFEPFILGGISVVTDPDCCGPAMAWNLGAGTNVWLNTRVGIRVDARVFLPFGGEGGLILARVGMTFR
jgi:hypothetical protein